MPNSIILSDTGPLISLEHLSEGYTFIRKLYSQIIIPQSVLDELTFDLVTTGESYLSRYGIEDLVEVQSVEEIAQINGIQRLDLGEQEAITLALELDLPLLIEETLGREIASAAGIQISGIAGQIIKGFRESIIDKAEAEKMLEELFENGRINKKIFTTLKDRL